jgi:hypothetical protein
VAVTLPGREDDDDEEEEEETGVDFGTLLMFTFEILLLLLLLLISFELEGGRLCVVLELEAFELDAFLAALEAVF